MAKRAAFLTLWHHHPLRVHIAMLFTALVVVACGAIMWNNHVQGRKLVLASTDRLVQEIASEAATELRGLFAPVETLVLGLSSGALQGADSPGAHDAALPSLAEMLKRHRDVDAVYVGYDNGEFFLLRALRDDSLRQNLGAPPEAAFMVQSIDRPAGQLRSRFMFLDESLARQKKDRAFHRRGGFTQRSKQIGIMDLHRASPSVSRTSISIGP